MRRNVEFEKTMSLVQLAASRAYRAARLRRSLFLTSLSFLALSAGGTAHAQTSEQAPVQALAADTAAVDAEARAAADQGVNVSEVVVTARRREERVQDVPIAITVLGGEFLQENEQVRLAQDVVTFAPNVNAAATDGRERPRWFVRGVGTNNTDSNGVSPIGVYRDEVYVANFYAQAFPLFDQQRVEVLSGPQGTLWGKNTTGGAISFVSNAPKFDRGGYLRAVAGSDNERGIEGAVTGAIIPDRLAARISFFHNEDDGWYRNLYVADVTPPRSSGWNLDDARRIGGNNETAARLQLLYTPSSNVDVLLSYHLRRYKGDQTPSYIIPDLYVAPINNPTFNQGYTDPANPLPYGYVWAAGNGVQTIDNDGGLLRVNWGLGDLTLTSITAYERNTLVRSADGNTAIPLRNNVSRQETPDQQFSQEIRLASPADGRFSWIAGAYYFDEKTLNRSWAGNLNVYTAPAAGRSYSLNSQRTDTESYALFGSATYGFTDRFKLTAGARASRETKDFAQSFTLGTGTVTFADPANWWRPGAVASPLITNSVATAGRTYESVTWDITPQYQISENALAYFHASYGYLSGGFDNRRNNAVSPAILQVFEYEPEKIYTYEAGLKTQWFDKRLTANASLFYYDYDSIQVLVILPSSGTNTNSTATVGNGYSNAAGKVLGAELTLDARPTDRLHLRAALGLLDTEYTDYPIQTGINYPRLGLVNATINPTGGVFTRAPKVTASVGADYEIPLGDDGGALELGAQYRYLSRQYYNPTLEFDHTLEQAGYSLVDLRGAWAFGAEGRNRLGVTVQNALDKQYLIHAIAPSNNASSGRQGRPTSVLVSLATRF